MSHVLVTGGAGYIGSHTCVQLLEAGYEVTVIDNLSNGSFEVISRVQMITGKNVRFFEGDIRDANFLEEIFKKNKFSAVIHFAGLKSVGESQKNPISYFDNNISGSNTLFGVMSQFKVFNLVFSSSATVYDSHNKSPLNENMPTGVPSNNYGLSKLIVENILQKICLSDARWSVALLRYFNPVGAHHSGLIGEDPHGTPNNLMPYITQVAIGRRDKLSIYGSDYPTPDGTGIRDYIHVSDLANAHLKALENREQSNGCDVWNIGTGHGHSVLQIIDSFKRINQIDIKYEMTERRDGDIAIAYADNSKALQDLGWSPALTLDDMIRDSWYWQTKNPNGYST